MTEADFRRACLYNKSLNAHVDPDKVIATCKHLAKKHQITSQAAWDAFYFDFIRQVILKSYGKPGKPISHWDSALAANTDIYDASAAYSYLLRLASNTTSTTAPVNRLDKKGENVEKSPYPRMWPALSTQEKVDWLKKHIKAGACSATRVPGGSLQTHISRLFFPLLLISHPPSSFPPIFSGFISSATGLEMRALLASCRKEYASLLLEFEVCSEKRIPDFMPSDRAITNFLNSHRRPATAEEIAALRR